MQDNIDKTFSPQKEYETLDSSVEKLRDEEKSKGLDVTNYGRAVAETFESLGRLMIRLTDLRVTVSADEREILDSYYRQCDASRARLVPLLKYWRTK